MTKHHRLGTHPTDICGLTASRLEVRHPGVGRAGSPEGCEGGSARRRRLLTVSSHNRPSVRVCVLIASS